MHDSEVFQQALGVGEPREAVGVEFEIITRSLARS
jgi:hypothetical protein